eukprot:scaffold239_cov382-Pavlova_lutheri.AAC.6
MNTCCISGEEKVYSRSNLTVISVFLLSSSFETHESNILDHTLEDARCSGKSDVETQLLAMLSAKIERNSAYVSLESASCYNSQRGGGTAVELYHYFMNGKAMQIKACSDAASSKRSLLNYCCHCSQELLCRPCTSFPSLSWVPHEPCQPIPPIAAGMLQTLGRRNVQRDESLVLATGTERTKCPGRQGPDAMSNSGEQ